MCQLEFGWLHCCPTPAPSNFSSLWRSLAKCLSVNFWSNWGFPLWAELRKLHLAETQHCIHPGLRFWEIWDLSMCHHWQLQEDNCPFVKQTVSSRVWRPQTQEYGSLPSTAIICSDYSVQSTCPHEWWEAWLQTGSAHSGCWGSAELQLQYPREGSHPETGLSSSEAPGNLLQRQANSLCETGWEFVFIFIFCGAVCSVPQGPFTRTQQHKCSPDPSFGENSASNDKWDASHHLSL